MKKLTIVLMAALLVPQTLVLARGSKAPVELQVMSYNIRTSKCDDGTNSWPFRAYTTLLLMKDVQPDLFGVQEATPDQVEFLNENLTDYKGIGVGREDGRKKGEHMSIYYKKNKYNLLRWGTWWLSETPDEPSKGWDARCFRSATWALLKDKASGRQFYVVNTHLDHVGVEARRKGLALVVEKIGEMNKEGHPLLLMGDFNVTPDNDCLTVLGPLGMLSARDTAPEDATDHLGTFHAWGHQNLLIDYIYWRGFSACTAYKTLTEKYDGRFVSDHYPIMARFAF